MGRQAVKEQRDERAIAGFNELSSFSMYDAWQLDDAVAIACKRLPMLAIVEALKRRPPSGKKVVSSNDAEFSDFVDTRFKTLKRSAIAAVEARTLPTITDAFRDGERSIWVEPRTFLLWAKEQGCLINRTLTEIDELRPISTKEKVVVQSESAPKTKRKKTGACTFPTPIGAKWPDVTIRFRTSSDVTVSINGIAEKHTYMQMGLGSDKTNKPIKAWSVLQELSERDDGLIPRPASLTDKEANLISDRLRTIRTAFWEYFGIDGDPIPWIGKERVWRPAFKLLPITTTRDLVGTPDSWSVTNEIIEYDHDLIEQDGIKEKF